MTSTRIVTIVAKTDPVFLASVLGAQVEYLAERFTGNVPAVTVQSHVFPDGPDSSQGISSISTDVEASGPVQDKLARAAHVFADLPGVRSVMINTVSLEPFSFAMFEHKRDVSGAVVTELIASS
jgi:hypothetical protein